MEGNDAPSEFIYLLHIQFNSFVSKKSLSTLIGSKYLSTVK